uniref:Elm1 n=1 Tax=Arundo donax TaxID=35708 RepID=A0A0A9D8J5_ARUDO
MLSFIRITNEFSMSIPGPSFKRLANHTPLLVYRPIIT